MLAQHLNGVVPGILAVVGRAAVNNDGQPRGPRLLHLPAKDLLLYVPWRVVIEVIESDLAPGNDLGMTGQLLHLRVIGLAGKLGFVRMNAQAGKDPVALRGNLDGAIERSRPGAAANG